MWAWLGTLAAKLIEDGFAAALGHVFPSLKPVDPAVQGQQQKDRADVLQSELNAKADGDQVRDAVDRDIAAHPSKLREHDKFEVGDDGKPIGG